MFDSTFCLGEEFCKLLNIKKEPSSVLFRDKWFFLGWSLQIMRQFVGECEEGERKRGEEEKARESATLHGDLSKFLAKFCPEKMDDGLGKAVEIRFDKGISRRELIKTWGEHGYTCDEAWLLADCADWMVRRGLLTTEERAGLSFLTYPEKWKAKNNAGNAEKKFSALGYYKKRETENLLIYAKKQEDIEISVVFYKQKESYIVQKSINVYWHRSGSMTVDEGLHEAICAQLREIRDAKIKLTDELH